MPTTRSRGRLADEAATLEITRKEGAMAIKVRKLGHALGAEVSGVDLSQPIDDRTFSEINRAFLENCVLVFHDQPLTREQHVAFSRRFGELDNNLARSAHMRVPEVPEIFLVTAEPVPSG